MDIEDVKRIDWPSSSFACEALLQGVYFQANSFGPMLEAKSIMFMGMGVSGGEEGARKGPSGNCAQGAFERPVAIA